MATKPPDGSDLKLADHLADLWYQDRERLGRPTDAYNGILKSLKDFLPENAAAGIAHDGEEAVVIALTDGALLLFDPPEKGGLLDARALPFPAIEGLSVRSALAGNADATYRVSDWQVSNRDSDWPTLTTREPLGAGFGLQTWGEAVMLALADALGWAAPLGTLKEELSR